MEILQDRAYFASRAAKAHILALGAKEPGIRQIHLKMAQRYEYLAGGENAPAVLKTNLQQAS